MSQLSFTLADVSHYPGPLNCLYWNLLENFVLQQSDQKIWLAVHLIIVLTDNTKSLCSSFSVFMLLSTNQQSSVSLPSNNTVYGHSTSPDDLPLPTRSQKTKKTMGGIMVATSIFKKKNKKRVDSKLLDCFSFTFSLL